MTSRRWISLLCAGLLILGLVLFRQRQLAEWKTASPLRIASLRILAPRFDLVDQHRTPVKFERFLGRQRVVLVFFDSSRGADADPRLQRLLQCAHLLQAQQIEVVAVSGATPFAVQQAQQRMGQEFSFPLLTDVSLKPDEPGDYLVHRQWGRFDREENRPLTGVFLIGRDGTVAVGADGVPLPVSDEDAVLTALCRGEWPG